MSNIDTVQKFLAALEAADLPAAEARLDENVVYENVGFSVDHGREAAINTLKGFMRFSDRFEIIMHAIAENGNIVLTERT
ncbi:MAG TPA: limonene-1,2-epoxide hydrolase family protein, partial [Turneriella sp.]|nr:limonene-1,2-epoxide hydrolase family protein [Turneriella sp.]